MWITLIFSPRFGNRKKPIESLSPLCTGNKQLPRALRIEPMLFPTATAYLSLLEPLGRLKAKLLKKKLAEELMIKGKQNLKIQGKLIQTPAIGCATFYLADCHNAKSLR